MERAALALVLMSLIGPAACAAQEPKDYSSHNPLITVTASDPKDPGAKFKAIDPKDQKAIKVCKAGGGWVGKDTNGNDACVTPNPSTPAR